MTIFCHIITCKVLPLCNILMLHCDSKFQLHVVTIFCHNVACEIFATLRHFNATLLQMILNIFKLFFPHYFCIRNGKMLSLSLHLSLYPLSLSPRPSLSRPLSSYKLMISRRESTDDPNFKSNFKKMLIDFFKGTF